MATRDVEEKLSQRKTCPWDYQECLLTTPCPFIPAGEGWLNWGDGSVLVAKARTCKHAGLALTRLRFFVTHPRSSNHPDPSPTSGDDDRG